MTNRVRFIQDAAGYAWKNTTATLVVRNDSSYAARSPAVVVEFQDGVIEVMQLLQPGQMNLREPQYISTGWTSIDDTRIGIVAFQWDGGPNYAIHGHSTRYLPELNLTGLHGIRERPLKIVIRLLADGYSRSEIILPVEFSDDPSIPDPENIPAEWL